MAIQLRRGDYNDFDPSQLLDGELAVVLENDPDTDDGTGLYVGFGDDNVKRVAFADETADVDVATTETAGIVKPDGTSITVDSDGTIHSSADVPIATTSTAGKVKPDGTTINVDANGKISAKSANPFTKGIVKPDGATITAGYDGTISVLPAASGKIGGVKPDGETITVDQDGTIHGASTVTPSSTDPAMDGTASAGSSTDYARADHVHPTDTSRASASDLTAHTGDTTAHVTAAERSTWNGKLDASLKGAANGVAELDASGKVPSSQLPSYVDDVLEYSAQSAFPSTGESGKIYVDTTTGKTYRWGGSSYVEISASLALGETDSTAHRGDHGKAAYDHASAKGSAFSSGLYKITTNAEGHVTAASSVEKSDITALGIPGDAYTLPTMSDSTKGGAKVGDGLEMTGDVLSTTNDMGLSGTSVGQVPVVAAVDSNGVPTAWGSVLLIWRTLTVTVTTHDAQTVTGVTVTVRLGGPTGEVLGTATYNGSPLTFLLQHGTNYYVSVSDDLRMYGPPSTASGTILANDASVTLTYAALESVLERDSVTDEYTNASVTEYFQRTRTGLVYGTTEPLSVATALTKTGANASLATPVGGYVGTPAVDPYEDLGPFLYRTANGYVDADGVPHITDIEGIDNTFARDGSNGNVWQIHGVIYEKWSTTATDNVHDITDTPATGFAPHPKCYLPDGTLRPYMVTAVYPLGKNPYDNNAPASISGVVPRTRNVSHNAGITICDTANTGYSLKSTYDDWYIKTMFEMKYATKHSQSVYAGCTSYNLQYNPAVAETGVKRVIVTNAQAANFVVGSNCQFGTRTVASDNDRNHTQNFDIFDKVTITSIEAYDTNNSAINFDVPSTFDSATTCLLSTAPWNCGCLDAVVGDGTITQAGRTNGKEPFKIQGIEVAHGMYEIIGDIIISNDGTTGWTPYVCADTKNAATSLTTNYTACADALPTNTSDGWKYPAHTVYSNGLRYGADADATSSTGLHDGTYTQKLATTGAREWLGLGILSIGSSAGLWFVSGGYSLGGTSWNIGSRLSGTGRAAA